LSAADPLAAVVAELDRCGIPYMLAGSFASAYHGEPRTTYDIDIVIDPSERALRELVRTIDPESFYASPEAAEEAWRRRGQFNLVQLATGWKVDLILRKDRPFSREEFSRRVRAEIHGVSVFVASAEDTIVAKLEWARAGGSERQHRDVIGIVDMCGPSLDRAYIERWASELGIEEQWRAVERAAASD
jgi:hypothetical protein